jgi:hypothetical protein
MKILFEQILLENSIFGTITTYQNLIKGCADKCRKVVRNGKNQQSQVSVCTSVCKVQNLKGLLVALQSLRGTGVSESVLNTKLIYVKMRLDEETKKLISYRQGLKKRQTTIPMNLSIKPFSKSYNPNKLD